MIFITFIIIFCNLHIRELHSLKFFGNILIFLLWQLTSAAFTTLELLTVTFQKGVSFLLEHFLKRLDNLIIFFPKNSSRSSRLLSCYAK